MEKSIVLMNAIIFFYIVQRISEIFISKNNEKWLKKNFQAIEIDSKESIRMKIFHTLWFISLFIEANIKHDLQPDETSAVIYGILGLCLVIRFHSMEKLKHFWTIKIFSLNHQQIITSGLYRYIRHPNYIAVVLELIFIPLLFKAYITLFTFSLLNILVLKKRINLEEKALMSHKGYNLFFARKKRFIPYFFMLLFSFSLKASEITYHFNNYHEAESSKNYIKFESISTKLGLISTGFDGYAKEIKIDYQQKSDEISNLIVIIPVKGLDTNNASRDEKMHLQIMEAEKYPVIAISTNEAIVLKEGEYTKDMVFKIKDKQTTRPVKLIIKKDNGKFLVSGTASVGLREAGLPDPSILIAKVRDLFELKFSIEMPN